MAYVYAHRKKSDNSIFYIGIGSDSTYKRAKSANGRNAKLGRVLCNKTKSAISQSKRKIVVNLLNGVFYESAMEAAYYNNINLNTLYSNLSSKRSNKTNLIYT